jgi:hypothetical protein
MTRLHPADVEAIARRVAELLQRPDEWVDAQTTARRLGVSRETVMAHREELGGEAVGNGPRPRWRFPARAAWESRPQTVQVAAPTRKRLTSRSGTALLPIRGPNNKARPGTTPDLAANGRTNDANAQTSR